MFSAPTSPMTLKQWFSEFGDEPFDYISGEKIEWIPPVAGVSFTANRLLDCINVADETRAIGCVYVGMTLVYLDENESVRTCLTPNVIFLSHAKFESFRMTYPQAWKVLPLMVLPDLVVEVISPTDRKADVRRKVTRYLEEGIPLVWVVDYINEVVEIFTPHGGHELRKSDTLTAGDIIPGFELKLETLFA